MKEDKKTKTFNSKLIISLSGIVSVTLMAVTGVITGGVAVAAVVGFVGGYATYRQFTK